MAQHKRFTLATDVAVYFCDPQSSWQRGSNESINGLLRQYFPKGTNLAVYSQERVDEIARQLNQRPRKALGFETPAERFDDRVKRQWKADINDKQKGPPLTERPFACL
jgi:IS30 family transposase